MYKIDKKVCCICKKELPITEYYKNKSSKDGLQYFCKACSRINTKKYQTDNPDKIKAYNRKHWWKYRDEKIKGERVRMDNRQVFLDSLKTPCVKCGESRVWVIQFHHKDNSNKLFSIGDSKRYHRSKQSIIEESKKCVCLCANCHKEFHYLYGMKPLNPMQCLEEYLNGGDNK